MGNNKRKVPKTCDICGREYMGYLDQRYCGEKCRRKSRTLHGLNAKAFLDACESAKVAVAALTEQQRESLRMLFLPSRKMRNEF